MSGEEAMDKSLIIIGAGVAGLAAGCYAQMNGYRSQILDLHTIPGGLCTWWRRGDHFPLPQPMTLGNLRQGRLVLKHHCFDPTMAPPGKSVLSVWCKADYDHWKRLRAEPAQHRAAKAQVLEQVIAAQAMPATRQQNPTLVYPSCMCYVIHKSTRLVFWPLSPAVIRQGLGSCSGGRW